MISFFLSGGTHNLIVNKSLGGLPSTTLTPSGVNALFNKVSESEAENGSTRFRCLYAINLSDYNLADCTLSLTPSDICLSYLGLNISDEIQNIKILGSPTFGTLKLTYDALINDTIVSQTTNEIDITTNPTETAQNIESALNSLTYISSVSVVAIASYSYNVIFEENDGGRSHNLLEVSDLSVSGATDTSVVRTNSGSPINQIAPNTGYDNQSPFEVSFDYSSVNLGEMRPGDIASFWIKRVVPTNNQSTSNERDGCGIKMTFRQIDS